MIDKTGEEILFDALSTRVDRHPTETLLATFGLDNSMRSGVVVIMVLVA